jgi:hypothetical protein
MSNAQQGTRGLSSADWIRLKRIRGANQLLATIATKTDIGGNALHPAISNQVGYSPEFHSAKVVGTSRIRRTASTWTDFKAFNSADYITQSQYTNNGINTDGKLLTGTKVCSCITFTPNKQGLCITCLYSHK